MDDSGHNTSKLPYVPSGLSADATEASTNGLFSPVTVVSNITGGVTYFMCQATGYKLTSNKELPSNCQHFSVLIPKTGKKSDGSDSPDGSNHKGFILPGYCSEAPYLVIFLGILKTILENTNSHNNYIVMVLQRLNEQ